MIRDTIDILRRYRFHFRNWISVMYHTYRGDSMIDIVLRSGYRDRVSFDYVVNIARYNGDVKIETLLGMLKNGKVPYKKDIITLKGAPQNGDPFRVFIYEEYKFLEVAGKTVIDVGANIGDTAIYFAINGAKRVISLEPFPHSYEDAVSNIKDNGLVSNVILLNAGYGTGSEVEVDEKYVSGIGTVLFPAPGGKKIKIYSLKRLFEEFGVDSAVVKFDCEGCEYGLLEEDEATLRKIEKIAMEYHRGPGTIPEKLESSGFKVRLEKSKRNRMMGYIYAERATGT